MSGFQSGYFARHSSMMQRTQVSLAGAPQCFCPVVARAMLGINFLKIPSIIIDNGSGSCKAGISGKSKPQSVITSVVGCLKQGTEEYYIGEKALSKKGAVLNYPIERGTISSWDDMQKLWSYIYKHVLEVKPSTRPVLLSEPPLNPPQNRRIMTEMMFEQFNVPALYLSVQATLALYASARVTGLVMDSGEGVTHTVPVYDGYCLPHGVLRLDVAGKDITEYLTSLLLKHRHFPSPISQVKKNIIKDIKEKFCYVVLDPKNKAAKKTEEVLKLPDGNVIKVNLHLCQAPEILFVPSIIGVETPAIHTMINSSIRKCDKDISGCLYRNVVLSGGSSLFRGLDERLLKEVEERAPRGIPIRIIVAPERSDAAWVGGSIISHLNSFEQMWFTLMDYRELGSAGIERKCF